MKKFCTLFLPVAFCVSAHAETIATTSPMTTDSAIATKPEPALKTILQKAKPTVKLGGYIIGKYSISDQSNKATNGGFDLRLIRLYADGYAFEDFYYKLQMQVNGAPGEDKGPRVVDAFVEWQKYNELRIKLGQFKRPFGFENPMNPFDVGFGAFSQTTTKLIGFNDRVGEHACNGRDVGAQLQGDFFPAADGHKWLHYQVGVFNGQGVNHTDKDNFKDVIGGIWISPIKPLRIAAFGWNGKYTNEGYSTGELQQVERKRWGFGVTYDADWMARAEYVGSKGQKVTDANSAEFADAWYVQAGYPICKNVKIFARWDCYRDNRQWNSLKANYQFSFNYYFSKNLFIQAEYDFTHDKSIKATADHCYNTFGLQVYCRF